MNDQKRDVGGVARSVWQPLAIFFLATLGIVSVMPLLNSIYSSWSLISRFSNPAGTASFAIYRRASEVGKRRFVQIRCETSDRTACDGWIEADNGSMSVPVRWDSSDKGYALMFLHPADSTPQWILLKTAR